jgi:hypothetical protein
VKDDIPYMESHKAYVPKHQPDRDFMGILVDHKTLLGNPATKYGVSSWEKSKL